MANPNAPTEGGGRRIPFIEDEANLGTAYIPLGDGDKSMGGGNTKGAVQGAAISGRVSGTRQQAFAHFPDTFKPFTLTAVTAEQLIWDPAAGKKVRILGIHLKATVETKVNVLDGTGGSTILTIGAGAAVPVTLGADTLGPIGILSGAADRNLYVTSSASAGIVGTVWGCEE